MFATPRSLRASLRDFVLCATLVAVNHGMRAQDEVRLKYEFVKKNGKPKFLRADVFLQVHLKDSTALTNSYRKHQWVGGNLQYTTADSLVLDQSEEHWYEVLYDAERLPVRWNQMDISSFDTVPNVRTIPLSAVDHVEYQHAMNGAGAFITVLSSIGLLVYAPLRAMSFRTGTFNGDRYLRVATPCAIALGVGLVVMPFTDGFRRLHVKLGP